MTDRVQLEVMGEISGVPADAGQRLLCRDAAGAWCLVAIQPGGDRRIVSEMVTPALAEQYALAILGCDDRTITKSMARLSMAVLIAGICHLARKDQETPKDGDAAPPTPAAQPPGAPPPAPGGDLFSASNEPYP